MIQARKVDKTVALLIRLTGDAKAAGHFYTGLNFAFSELEVENDQFCNLIEFSVVGDLLTGKIYYQNKGLYDYYDVSVNADQALTILERLGLLSVGCVDLSTDEHDEVWYSVDSSWHTSGKTAAEDILRTMPHEQADILFEFIARMRLDASAEDLRRIEHPGNLNTDIVTIKGFDTVMVCFTKDNTEHLKTNTDEEIQLLNYGSHVSDLPSREVN